MSTGLAASTVTPGSIAPDESRTTPEIPLPICAKAVLGVNVRTTQKTNDHAIRATAGRRNDITPPCGGANCVKPITVARVYDVLRQVGQVRPVRAGKSLDRFRHGRAGGLYLPYPP